jgi:hypothetical protein
VVRPRKRRRREILRRFLASDQPGASLAFFVF